MPDEQSTGETPTEETNDNQDEMSLEEQLAALKAEQKRTAEALRKANKEAETRRKQLNAFEQKEEERNQAEMTELEKAQKKIKDMESAWQQQQQAYRQGLLQAETRAIAAGLGFQNPEDAYRLADLSSVEVGEDGSIDGIKEALETLAESKPYLLGGDRQPGAPNLDAGAGNSPSRKGLPALTAEERKVAEKSGIPLDEYARIKAERKGLYAFVPEPKEK